MCYFVFWQQNSKDLGGHMSCVLEKITPSILVSLQQSLSLSAGYEVSTDDELEYFHEHPHNKWFIAKNLSNDHIGFIRHFDLGNWAQVEIFVSDQVAKRGLVAKDLIQKLIDENQFSGLRLRFDILEEDKEINQAIENMGLSEKKQRLLYFEIDELCKTGASLDFDVITDEDAPQVADVLSHLHPVTEPQVKAWIKSRDLRASRVEGKLASVVQVSISDKSAEIVRIATHKDFLRRGLALSLLEQIKSEMRDKGVKRIFLKVDEEKRPAVSLYKRVGFIERKELTENWHSKWF